MRRLLYGRVMPVAVVVLAAALRLGRLDLVEFKADEVRHCERALMITERGGLPLTGGSGSVGVDKPPLMPYLMAIPLSVSRDPRIATGFIALLNVAAVAACYYVAKRHFGQRTALIGSLLYAVNPWAIVYSRKIFTADVLAPFTALMLLGVCEAIVRRRPWGIAVAVVSLACLLLITFSPLPLVLVLGTMVLLYARRVSWPHVLIGCVVSLVLFAPYLWYDYGLGFRNLRAMLSGSVGGEGAQWGPQSIRFASWIHSGYNLASLAGKSYGTYIAERLPFGWLDVLAMGAFALAVGYVAKQSVGLMRREEDGSRYVILTAWIVVPVAFLLVNPVRLYPHYLVILYPAGYIAMGALWDAVLTWLGSRGPRSVWLRALAWVVVGAIAGWQAYATWYTFDFVAKHDTAGGYGLPVKFSQEAAGLAVREAREVGAEEVWVITEGSDLAYEGMPLVLNYMLEPSIDVTFLGQGGHTCLLLPVERPAVYLVTREDYRALEAMAALGGEQKGEVRLPDGGRRAEVFVVPGLSKGDVLSLPREVRDERLDVGLRLLGYDWPDGVQAGESVDLVTYWAFEDIEQDVTQEQHSLFNHLVGDRGRTWAQQDGLGLPERHWKDGYVLMQWFSLLLPSEMPAGEYRLLTGLYRLSDGQRSALLDEQGHPAGDTIELGSLTVGRS